MLAWANGFDVCCCLESNDLEGKNGFRRIIAAGVWSEIKIVAHNRAADGFQKLQEWHDKHKDWAFGFLSYDLKNDMEALVSENETFIEVPLLHFFVPLYQFEIVDDTIHIIVRGDKSAEKVWQEVQETDTTSIEKNAAEIFSKVGLKPRITKEKYLNTIHKIKNDIVEGDYYEINFCQAFQTHFKIKPLNTFVALNKIAAAPFATYYKLYKKHLIGASPERFLQKNDRQLYSQPIKGTARRGANEQEDVALRNALRESEKDRAENIMIVDLVRNDFAKCCETATVKVPELFGVYTFNQVHQLISTVTGSLREGMRFSDALRATFPMGSMTGAPKVMAMQRIELYENSRRGWYSGAVGYITPQGDFDFNVVIRSIFFDEENNALETQVGGAIVFDSVAELEYEECMVKLKAVLQVLNAAILL